MVRERNRGDTATGGRCLPFEPFNRTPPAAPRNSPGTRPLWGASRPALRIHGQRPVIQRCGLVVPSLLLAQHSQVVQRQRHVRMVGSQQLLLERERPPVQRLRVGQTALLMVIGGQVVQVDRHFVMLRPVVPLEDGQHLAVQRLALGVLALSVQERRQRRHIRRHIGVVRAQRFLTDRHRAAGERLAAGMVAAGVFQAAEVVIQRRHPGVLGAYRRNQAAQGLPVEPGCLREPAIVLVQHAKLVAHARRGEVVFTEFLHCQGQGSAVERFGPTVLSLDPIKVGQPAQSLHPDAPTVSSPPVCRVMRTERRSRRSARAKSPRSVTAWPRVLSTLATSGWSGPSAATSRRSARRHRRMVCASRPRACAATARSNRRQAVSIGSSGRAADGDDSDLE